MTLAAQGVVVRHGTRTVLDGVDLQLAGGGLVLLCGRNGAGKSTLLRVLLGAQRPDAGATVLDGRPLGAWTARERAQRVGYVPQAADCPFEFTGRDLVAMGRHPFRRGWQRLQAEDHDAVARALQTVDALSFCERSVTSLSGGELRRIALARALATEAPLLLLDEPTATLDLEHALAIGQMLRGLREQGRGVLVATHDFNLLAPFADRVVVLHRGRVEADGPPAAALTPAVFATVFGVTAAAPEGYFPRDFRLLDR